MCKIKYDRVSDILQVLEGNYNAKEVEFFEAIKDSPICLIAKKNKVIGLEFIGFKSFARSFYKNKKKELCLKNLAQAEEFIRGSLYNMFMVDFLNTKLVTEEEEKRTILFNPINMKNSIKELCAA